jgi:NAD(P)-dependent dehydrogenase (short-subunit alcohol dehydrogenase family)
MTLLEGRVVLVTGGGRGLGRAHSLQLARQGATVVVNDAAVALDGAASGDSPGATTPAQDVVAEIEAAGGAAMADGTSVCDWHGVAALVARIVDRFGRVDAVVNNAGLLVTGPLHETREDDFDVMLDTHMKGTFTVIRHVSEHWHARAAAGEPVRGRIVNTVSGAGLWGTPGNIAYSTAKSAIAGMTIAAALELADIGVTVNAISPIAATRMTMGTQYNEDLGEGPERTWHPLDPANASPVVAWLCSDDAGWLTGAILRVDGNTVSRIDGYTVGETFRARGGEAVTVEELPAMVRRLYGVMPVGLFHLTKPDVTVANPGP